MNGRSPDTSDSEFDSDIGFAEEAGLEGRNLLFME